MDRLAAQPASTFRGHYTLDTGASWFRPCGMAPTDSAWWVTVIGTAATQADVARRDGRLSGGRPVYVEWQGVVTRDGEVGPRGPGALALLVRAIDLLRAPADTDCR